MKFGKIGVTAAIAATVLIGSLIGAAPAQALSFGDTLEFSTDDAIPFGNEATLADLGGGLFSFDVGAIDIDVASVFGPASAAITDAAITLQEIAAIGDAAASFELVGTNIPFLSGLDDGLGGNTRTYTLTSFTLNLDDPFFPGSTSFAFNAALNGFFQPPTPGVQGIGGLGGFGALTSDGTTISGAITAVPTPAAVLPGLIGMGTAAFRKKKQEKEEESVAAEVKA